MLERFADPVTICQVDPFLALSAPGIRPREVRPSGRPEESDPFTACKTLDDVLAHVGPQLQPVLLATDFSGLFHMLNRLNDVTEFVDQRPLAATLCCLGFLVR
jgi:hypothetical protein